MKKSTGYRLRITVALLVLLFTATCPLSTVLAANCDPNGEIDPSTWSLIEAYTCDPNNPGNAGQEWACFDNDGSLRTTKFSNDVSDTNRCPLPSSPGVGCAATGDCNTQTPPLSTTPITAPNPVPSAPSAEEQAVYNQCQLTSPDGVCPQSDKPKKSIWEQLWSVLTSLFLFPAQNPDQLTNQSLQLHQNNFPYQVSGKDSGQSVDESLGTDNGYYSINLPFSNPSDNSSKDVADKEKLRQQTLFPDGITPITGTSGQ